MVCTPRCFGESSFTGLPVYKKTRGTGKVVENRLCDSYGTCKLVESFSAHPWMAFRILQGCQSRGVAGLECGRFDFVEFYAGSWKIENERLVVGRWGR